MPSDAQTYLFDFSTLLNESERLVWQAARDLGERHVAPLLRDANEAGEFPRQLIPIFAQAGFLGASLHGYECAGMSPVEYGLINLELERQDSGIRSFCSVQSSLVMWPIWAYGSEEQKQRFLPRLARGEAIGCFGLTEPNAGSDPGSMRTHAKQLEPGGDYILNGQKMWITNSPIADVAVVWAKTLDFGASTPDIRGFLVERNMKGFSTPETTGKLSLRVSCTGEIVLDDVRVPVANLLPGVRGLKGPLGCLNKARYGISWGAIGAAMDVYERARRYAMERVQFNRPIAAFQFTQAKLVDMHNAIIKAQLMAVQFGRIECDTGLSPAQVSMLKRDNVACARECAQSARTILGGNGIAGDFHVMRHLCNLEAVYTYEGTHEIHTLAIGRALTGHSAFA